MVQNPPSKTQDVGSILGQGTKIPHAAGQISSTREAYVLQQRLSAAKKEKRNELPSQEETGRKLRCILLSERSPSEKATV